MTSDRMVVSYRALRHFVGGLGIALPPGLIVGGIVAGDGFLKTLSTYYHSESPILHGIFVGTLSSVGVFLICYKGHERGYKDCGKTQKEFWGDNWVANVAGFFALCIAIFPTSKEDCTPTSCAEKVFSGVHDASTLIFLIASTVMVLYLFRKTKPGGKPSDGKKKRNRIYVVCGVVMGAGTLAVVILSTTKFEPPHALLAIESVVILAFGAAWFVKALRPWG